MQSNRTARAVYRVVVGIALVPVVLAAFTAIYVNFNRTNLPDLDGFIRFEPPTMGHVYDANGHVLAELGRERRDIIRYEEIPDVVRGAILSAEDENFFSHSGVDYSVFLRLLAKTNIRSLVAHFTRFDDDASKRPPVFPQGGSTITQQLVRGYFLQKLSSTKNSNSLQHEGVLPHVLAFVIGVPGTNKLLLKIETIRLSLWIEGEMRKQYGSRRRAKEELFARYANFVYLGNGRYGFAAASDYYFHKPIETFTVDDADKAALLAGITKSPGEYAPTVEDLQKPTRRRNQILSLMVANHFLPAEVAQRLKLAPIRLADHAVEPVEAPAAVETTLEELKQLDASLGAEIGVEQLLEGHIQVYSTVDDRIQNIANMALENGLKAYEKRHPQSKGLIQGSVVVLRNSDSAILAETGGRESYKGRNNTYGDYNRVTQSRRQPGSAMKPFVYLAAFRRGALDLNTSVPDEPISVGGANARTLKWIANFDNQFEGMIPARQALAESRNAAAIWVASQIGIDSVLQTAQDVGIRTTLRPYLTTALGASEVTLVELANAYRLMAGGMPGEPHVIDKIDQTRGGIVYSYHPPCCLADGNEFGLSMIQEGLRGVVRIPSGTAHTLDSHAFPIPVMGKTGTTNNYRDALFIGSTFGPDGITVAVRIGFDDNRSLGAKETGALAALPVFRETMLKVYLGNLAGPAPRFPVEMEENIDAYLRGDLPPQDATRFVNPLSVPRSADDGTEDCSATLVSVSTPRCEPSGDLRRVIYPSKSESGRLVFMNE
ncbi:MAG TPA: transglycosylase domain-containing protein [Candidatus Acidoferrales bacterium]|nr:transglycosylase domain-containing protein [Candidatus Acidoferrales bacterium]